jgi:hypothetical protein
VAGKKYAGQSQGWCLHPTGSCHPIFSRASGFPFLNFGNRCTLKSSWHSVTGCERLVRNLELKYCVSETIGGVPVPLLPLGGVSGEEGFS